MSKPIPLDKPTRRTVEALFRELDRRCYDDADYREYQRLYEEREALAKKLLNVPAMKKLEARRDAAHQRSQARSARIASKLLAVRQKYLAEGLTPPVQREIRALVKESRRGA
jgi:hypothetical protein